MHINDVIKGLYAGIVIGLGGHAYLMAPDKVIGAFLFSIGLMSVVVFQLSLCTGKMCFKQSYNSKTYIPLVLLFNIIGAGILGVMDRLSKPLSTAANATVNMKLEMSNTQVLVDSIICTLFIGIAVKGYKKADGFGKPLMIVMGVMGFILSGAQHIIANVYYFVVASGCKEYTKEVIFLLINLLGNYIGGIVTWWIDQELET